MVFPIGPQELIIILLIVLVLFGATRVPQLMKGLGIGIKEFKQAVKDDDTGEQKSAGGSTVDGASSAGSENAGKDSGADTGENGKGQTS